MVKNQTIVDITSKLIVSLDELIKKEVPDVVIVQGDTTTAFVGALAAFYNKIPIAHVEAGLRTFSKYSPFPEEINRKLTDALADLYFVPTLTAKENLVSEGYNDDNIYITGNTVVDALNLTVSKLSGSERGDKWYIDFKEKYNLDLNKDIKRILITGHRRESFGKGFENICHAILEIASLNPDIDIIYPVHLNPNVQEPVFSWLGGIKNIYLLPPLDYEPFIYLMTKSYLILTDSGGVQEEAPALGKPVLVMRETTERPEGINAGTAILLGTEKESIFRAVQSLLSNPDEYEKMSKAINPYGTGVSGKKIVNQILQIYNG